MRAINASLELEVGTHVVVVRAWDTSGAYGDQTLMLTVSSKPAVAVSMPAPGLNVGSPIPIQAFATPPSGDVISGWEIYVDGTPMYNAGAVCPQTRASTQLWYEHGIQREHLETRRSMSLCQDVRIGRENC